MLRRSMLRSLPKRRLASSVAYNVPPRVTDFGAYQRTDSQTQASQDQQHSKPQHSQAIQEPLARKVPRVNTLHSRLGLGTKFSHSTLARTLVCNSAQTKFADNLGMATFGKNLIQFYVHEHFTVKYPRLPPQILKHLISLYSSINALGKVGENMGIEEDSRPPLARYLANEKDEDLLGKLMYSANKIEKEQGVVEVVEDESKTKAIDKNTAMASFVRALAAGVYAHGDLGKAKQFIHDYIIKPNRLDIASLLSFDQPTRELAVLCAREQLEAPVSRLMMETGRYSKAPVFVVGVFSGTSKLGEGQGSSLKEARTRAAVNALKTWYLYSPVDAKLPSDGGDKQHVDQGVVVV